MLKQTSISLIALALVFPSQVVEAAESKELRQQRNRLSEGYSFAPLEETNDSFRFTIAASPEKVLEIFNSFRYFWLL